MNTAPRASYIGRRFIARGVAVALLLTAASLFGYLWKLTPAAHKSGPRVASGIADEPRPSPLALKTLQASQPLSFEPNGGLLSPRVKYLGRAPGYSVLITDKQVAIVLPGQATSSSLQDNGRKGAGSTTRSATTDGTAVVYIVPVDPAPGQGTRAIDRLPGRVNYFLGNDPGKWRTNVPTFGEVVQRSVWKGVDVAWHGNNRQLECDFIVAPGASPQAIQLAFNGAKSIDLDRDGNLHVSAGEHTLKLLKPVVYQEAGGARRELSGRYIVANRNTGPPTVRFEVGHYD